jgi:4-amino-4-deoxy-L-arabinose transferase-like glycosyltransferase
MLVKRHDPLSLAFILLAVLLLIRLLAAGVLPFADTTEPRYAEIARLMAASNDWITPWYNEGTPFWGKPPLSFWSQAIFIKLFGSSEFAIRLPSVLMSILTVLIMANYVKRSAGKVTAIYSGLIYLSMALPFVSAGAVMTDTFLVLGTTLALIGFLDHYRSPSRFSAYYFYLGMAIGLLAKGPIAGIFCVAPIAGAFMFSPQQRASIIEKLQWKSGMMLLLVLVLPWYILAEIKTPGFINYFILGEHLYRYLDPGWQGDLYGSAHDRPRGTIWLYWVMASFPWGIVLLGMLFSRLWARGKFSLPRIAMSFEDKVIAFSVLTPLVFFTAAGNILWTYALPTLPFTALLIAKWLKPEQQRPTTRIGYLALTVPLTTAVLVALVLTGNIQLNSQKVLVSRVNQETHAGSTVYYLGDVPFSGRFYTQGNASSLDIPMLKQQAEQAPDDFLVIVNRREISKLEALNDINAEYLIDNGSYELFRLSKKVPEMSQLSIR